MTTQGYRSLYFETAGLQKYFDNVSHLNRTALQFFVVSFQFIDGKALIALGKIPKRIAGLNYVINAIALRV